MVLYFQVITAKCKISNVKCKRSRASIDVPDLLTRLVSLVLHQKSFFARRPIHCLLRNREKSLVHVTIRLSCPRSLVLPETYLIRSPQSFPVQLKSRFTEKNIQINGGQCLWSLCETRVS